MRGARFFARLSFTLFFLLQNVKNCLPCSKASPCLIVPAHNEAKIVCRFAAFPCLKKNAANFIFFGKNVKPCLTSRLPLGGKLSTSLTDEGRSLLRTGCFKQFNKKIPPFFIGSKKAPCFSQDAFHIKSLIPLYFPQYRRRFPSFLPRFPQAFLPSRTRRCSYRR